MTDEFDSHKAMERLRSEDPTKDRPEEPGERDAVRARTAALLEDERPLRQRRWPRLAIATAVVLIIAGVGLSLVLGGSSSGPESALAIDKGPKWVTLTIKDPSASDAEMNAELAAAGIDRVRVRSVPGPAKGVGTWAGYAEFGPTCQGGVKKFGFGVDIPATTPFSPANRHSADSMIKLTVPHPDSGALHGEVLGSPYSGATLRIDAQTIDDPSNSAKVLVPIRPKTPRDVQQHENQIGPSELIALGGVFAQYGHAYQDGRTSCSDFGLKPIRRTTYPPPGADWLDLQVSDTETGAQRMTDQIQAAGIDGEVRLIPAQPQEVGRFLGFQKDPPLPSHSHVKGNKLDVIPHDSTGKLTPNSTDLAIRRSAFTAFTDSNWIFYVGGPPQGSEKPQVLLETGPEDAKKALESGRCGAVRTTTKGHRSCISVIRGQVPVP